MKETGALVYCTGTDLDLASNLTFYVNGSGGATYSAAASVHYSTYASARFSNLKAGTRYSFYAEALTAEGQRVTSATGSFETPAPSTSKGWLEMPAKGDVATAKEYYILSGERNYTAYYDTQTYSSLWVAYPLAKGHMGSLARPSPDPWAAYSGLSSDYQINVWDGSYGVNYAGSNPYARGHQIANADRNGNSSMQNQTFLAINSTPQIQNGFNGGIWASLEQAIQNHAKNSSDSLYVTTGPVYRTAGGSESIKYIQPSKDSKKCPVPNYYFKVVMKVKRSGNAITSAMAVGFWFEHRVYESKTETYDMFAVSVDEIERLTGYNFFANLPDDIEASAEQNASWSAFSSR